eukprot:PLAT2893.1.p1 GENE.PLAT2893.1~~PLAT2893.1.p1  ORF type:complete len:561 (+),score=309.02 PLAT2893.1:990-2672(+)
MMHEQTSNGEYEHSIDCIFSFSNASLCPLVARTVRTMTTRMIGDRYEVHHTLGEGLQGVVKLGTDTVTGEKVALKLVKRSKLGKGSRELKNVEREVSIMSRIEHPYVISMRDCLWEAELASKVAGGLPTPVVAIVMELATGGELFDMLMFTGRFPEDIARSYFVQLIEGLAHCHDNGVCHRDLKPENLLLDGEFTLKITDFGLSALNESEDGSPSMLRTECGTRGYMAPEVLSHRPYDGTAADVWSAGVIAFILICGFPPFQLAHPSDWWFDRVRKKQYDLFWSAHRRNARVSDEAAAMLNKIFVADPAERATIADLREDPWFCGETVPAETLAAELARRQAEVEREKRREREEEMAARGGKGFDPTRDAHRSVGAAAPAIPMPEEPLPAKVEDAVKRYTTFYSELPALNMLDRLAQAFSELGGRHTLEGWTVQATVAAPLGAVTLSASVFDAGDDLCYVVVRRVRGDMFSFQNVYRALCAACADIICAPPGGDFSDGKAADDDSGKTADDEPSRFEFSKIVDLPPGPPTMDEGSALSGKLDDLVLSGELDEEDDEIGLM